MNLSPCTAAEVALALALDGDEGMMIAGELLAGKVRFKPDELAALAKYKGVTVEELAERDPAFEVYRDPVTEARKMIAKGLIRKGFEAEFVAEVCYSAGLAKRGKTW